VEEKVLMRHYHVLLQYTSNAFKLKTITLACPKQCSQFEYCVHKSFELCLVYSFDSNYSDMYCKNTKL